MPTYIWIDHDIEDARQIIVNAPDEKEALDIVLERILPEIVAEYRHANENKPSHQKFDTYNPERAATYIRQLVISNRPTVLHQQEFFQEGYWQ